MMACSGCRLLDSHLHYAAHVVPREPLRVHEWLLLLYSHRTSVELSHAFGFLLSLIHPDTPSSHTVSLLCPLPCVVLKSEPYRRRFCHCMTTLILYASHQPYANGRCFRPQARWMRKIV